jgi:Fe-S-cluster-containing hydrogenase component 2
MRYLESVVSLELDAARCSGCGLCVAVCPHAVFRLEHKRAVLADRGACAPASAARPACCPAS